MNEINGEQENIQMASVEAGNQIAAFVEILREPVLVLNSNLKFHTYNTSFSAAFRLNDNLRSRAVHELFSRMDHPEFFFLLESLLPEKKRVEDFEITFQLARNENKIFAINARQIMEGGERLFLLSFMEAGSNRLSSTSKYQKTLKDILNHAPAMVCILKGPEHIFEVANSNYLRSIGSENVQGRPVKEVLPEVDHQGFIEILDRVYATGKPFLGNEVAWNLSSQKGMGEKSYFDFLYQPIWNDQGEVDGIFVHAVDVTEKVVAHKRLEESKINLKNLVDSIPAIVWITDCDGKVSYLNKNWFQVTGQAEVDAYNQGWTMVVHPSQRKEVGGFFRKAQKERGTFNMVFKLFYYKTGKYRWVHGNGQPKFDESGEYEGMVGTFIDVHEEKIKEQLVREKEHRVRNIVEEATVATAVYVGLDMRIELANDAMLELWGKNRAVIGKNLREALPELEGQPFHKLLEEVFRTGKIYWGKQDKVDLEIGNQLHTGYFNFTYKPLRNEEGEIYGILNMALDVTEMVESKAQLKESEFHFRQMADLMPEKVANSDAEGNFVYFNQGWLDYTGRSSEELISDGWFQFVHPEEREEYLQKYQEALLTENYFEMELRCLDKNGKYKWNLSRAEAVRDERGKVKMWIWNNTDIQKLKEEEKHKEDFLKMVSHELKTPVTSIQGYVQMLLKFMKEGVHDTASLPIKPSLERMDHQLKRLRRLIAEMLDLTRVEENKLELQKSVFSLNELVEETVQDIQRTNTRNTVLTRHAFKGDVCGDRDRIGQVLINLITNAIKYSPEHQEVEVGIEQGGDNRIKAYVRDKGIGIDPKIQREIFKRFYRAGMKQEETYSGFGIGLYLANEIINRHKGYLGVKSELDKGSEFYFILALANKQKV